jgi:ribose transport system ATP-binding protein
MDEPTSSLAQADSEKLFEAIGRLRSRGVSIVYISHFLEECQQICDLYTVLRDGESVTSGAMAGAPLSGIIRAMVGRELSEIYPHTPHRLGAPLLEVKSLAAMPKPRQVSFTLREGEILGIAGLVGTGRTETFRALFGLDRIRAGTVVLDGGDRTHSTPRARLNDGIGLLSENRKEEGLMLNRSLADNLTATNYAPISTAGFVSRSKQQRTTAAWMEKLQVRARDASQPVGELSGGNQQKIAIGRLLHHQARILLMDEPTRGIDVGSKAQIYRLMGELAAAGKAVVFVSSYLPELLGVCDTIGVMCRGVLSDVKPAGEWTEHSMIATSIGANASTD